jgi:hypothetical protein
MRELARVGRVPVRGGSAVPVSPVARAVCRALLRGAQNRDVQRCLGYRERLHPAGAEAWTNRRTNRRTNRWS